MIASALTISFVFLGTALFLGLFRFLRGPTALERLVAFDVINGLVIAIIAALCLAWKETFFVESLLVFSIFGFLSTCTLVFYLDMAAGSRDPNAALKTNSGDEAEVIQVQHVNKGISP